MSSIDIYAILDKLKVSWGHSIPASANVIEDIIKHLREAEKSGYLGTLYRTDFEVEGTGGVPGRHAALRLRVAQGRDRHAGDRGLTRRSSCRGVPAPWAAYDHAVEIPPLSQSESCRRPLDVEVPLARRARRRDHRAVVHRGPWGDPLQLLEVAADDDPVRDPVGHERARAARRHCDGSCTAFDSVWRGWIWGHVHVIRAELVLDDHHGRRRVQNTNRRRCGADRGPSVPDPRQELRDVSSRGVEPKGRVHAKTGRGRERGRRRSRTRIGFEVFAVETWPTLERPHARLATIDDAGECGLDRKTAARPDDAHDLSRDGTGDHVLVDEARLEEADDESHTCPECAELDRGRRTLDPALKT